MADEDTPLRKVMPMTRARTLGKLVCLLVSLLCCPHAHAQGFNYWTDPAGGFWNDPTAWSDGFVPPTQGANVGSSKQTPPAYVLRTNERMCRVVQQGVYAGTYYVRTT